MSSDTPLIDVKGLGKRYEIYEHPRDRLKQMVLPKFHNLVNRARPGRGLAAPTYFRDFWALRDLSFQVRPGESFGVIGRNGSGKSTLLQILAGTMAPTEGTVSVEGRIAALLELGSGFNPEFTGRENVLLNARILGLSQSEIEERYDRILSFADIGNFIEQPVKTYSSGMFVRLAFAVQAHIDASIVIIDEALAVGDVFFRQKCYARLEALRDSGAAIILVSHSMPDIEQYCERAIVLDHGRMHFAGPSAEASKRYYVLNQTQQVSELTTTASSPIADTKEGGGKISRPSQDAFFDVSSLSQVSNGRARCVRSAIANERGEAHGHFRQGQTVVFYSEFTVDEDIEVPIYGTVIRNDRGIIVHGKNSWQVDTEAPTSVSAGSTISCRQVVKLDIAPGEYTFEIGLACIPAQMWRNRTGTSHEEFDSNFRSLCYIAFAGSFSVGIAIKNGVSILTHHGVADLPGTIEIATKVQADAGQTIEIPTNAPPPNSLAGTNSI